MCSATTDVRDLFRRDRSQAHALCFADGWLIVDLLVSDHPGGPTKFYSVRRQRGAAGPGLDCFKSRFIRVRAVRGCVWRGAMTADGWGGEARRAECLCVGVW